MLSKSDFRAYLEQSDASDRSFGLLMAAFWLVLGFVRLTRGGEVRWWAVAFAANFFLLALAAPGLLRAPKTAWLFLGYLLGRIVNPIVLNILYFGVITPAALVMRLAGRDALCLKRDPRALSYWRRRTNPASDMNLQF